MHDVLIVLVILLMTVPGIFGLVAGVYAIVKKVSPEQPEGRGRDLGG